MFSLYLYLLALRILFKLLEQNPLLTTIISFCKISILNFFYLLNNVEKCSNIDKYRKFWTLVFTISNYLSSLNISFMIQNYRNINQAVKDDYCISLKAKNFLRNANERWNQQVFFFIKKILFNKLQTASKILRNQLSKIL